MSDVEYMRTTGRHLVRPGQPERQNPMSKTANAMTPIAIDAKKVSIAHNASPAARAAAADNLLVTLAGILERGTSAQEMRADLAVSVWNLRLTYIHIGADKVKRPDYNGASSGYQAAYSALLVKAGFTITETMTPYEQHSMRLARKEVGAAIRYELRKLADKALTPAQLRAAGFHYATQLGETQKLDPTKDVATKREPKALRVDELISNAITELANAAARASDVRDLTPAERKDLAGKLGAAAATVLTLLGVTAKPAAKPATKRTPKPEVKPLVNA